MASTNRNAIIYAINESFENMNAQPAHQSRPQNVSPCTSTSHQERRTPSFGGSRSLRLLALATFGGGGFAAPLKQVSATVVQIPQSGNYVTDQGSQIYFDLAVDGPGVFGGYSAYGAFVAAYGSATGTVPRSVRLARAALLVEPSGVAGIYDSVSTRTSNARNSGSTTFSVCGLWDMVFTDDRVNNGDPTTALVQLTAGYQIPGLDTYSVVIDRIVFDDADPSGMESGLALWNKDAMTAAEPLDGFPVFNLIPEPSSLGLLAMGAAGLLVRRRKTD